MKFKNIPESKQNLKINIEVEGDTIKFDLSNVYIREEWKFTDIMEKLKLPANVNGKEELLDPFEVFEKVVVNLGPRGCVLCTKDEYIKLMNKKKNKN